jgi:hypothetical protein
MERFKLELSELNPNTRARSELVFTEGGHWEQNQGPNQTRRFAECLLEHVRMPWSDFSLLDVGCALGDALPVWHRTYPTAKLYGCDVAESAVRRCRERYGHLAEFFRASFEEIEGFWDVIYCSNVLEHFEQYSEISAWLLAHCKVLFALTPFAELRDGSPLRPGRQDERAHHVVTLYRDSFDELIESGKASRIETAIFGCPGGGWGLTRRQRVRLMLGVILKNRYITQEPLQILYAIHNSGWQLAPFLRSSPETEHG